MKKLTAITKTTIFIVILIILLTIVFILFAMFYKVDNNKDLVLIATKDKTDKFILNNKIYFNLHQNQIINLKIDNKNYALTILNIYENNNKTVLDVNWSNNDIKEFIRQGDIFQCKLLVGKISLYEIMFNLNL
ncbi:UNVERIFIED_CONTAM: hypothetical protein O8I53_05795 [Campylobacter lari]